MCITHKTTSKHQKQPSTKRTVAKVHFLLKLLSESCSRLRASEQTAQWLTTKGTDTDTNNTNNTYKHRLSLLPTTRGTDWSKISTYISIKHCNININMFHWDKQWLTCMQLKHSWNIGRQLPIIAGHWFRSWPPGWVTCIAILPLITLLALSVSFELVSSSARVASVKYQQGLVLSDIQTQRSDSRLTWVW